MSHFFGDFYSFVCRDWNEITIITLYLYLKMASSLNFLNVFLPLLQIVNFSSSHFCNG